MDEWECVRRGHRAAYGLYTARRGKHVQADADVPEMVPSSMSDWSRRLLEMGWKLVFGVVPEDGGDLVFIPEDIAEEWASARLARQHTPDVP